jgi:LuxR family transcriptional regulator, maltose regulon positive regulatory protein
VAIPILKTKLYIPPVRPGLVSRTHLVERLEEGLRQGRKLTLISAPAGYGKTTLVSSWVWQHDLRAAWVSLDEGDNDPLRFWAYVIAALQTVDPTIGLSLTATLGSLQPPPLEALTTALINDLAETGGAEPCSLALVLDDYHTIVMPEIHDSMDFLLGHCPPGLHIVITTREDPPLSLPRLRGRRQLTEIRAADLRFTPEEATQLLNAVMELDLAADDVTALSDRTEGWVVGLQMAALSLQREARSSQRAFVRAFAGSERLVAGYLVGEVLERQPPRIRDFLLQTSVLERLCGPLCDAVTGGKDARHILRELEAANLFIVPLDHTRRWYRYHGLFAELLRDRLTEQADPADIAALHQRASEWYAGEGFWEEAISHAFHAADERRAADLVAMAALPAISRAEFRLVSRWLDAIPEGTVRADPILCIARAWCALPHSVDGAQRWVARAEEAARENVGHSTQVLVAAHAAALRVAIARADEAPSDRIVELCQEALGQIPEDSAELRAIVAFWMGHACLDLGDDAAADRAFDMVTRMESESESHTTGLVMRGLRAWTNLNRGRLHDAAAICRDALRAIVEPAEAAGQRLPMACYLYIVLGQVHLLRNELEAAARLLERGIGLGELTTTERPILVEGYCALARLRSVEGRYEQGLALIDEAEQTMRLWLGGPGYVPAVRARLWLVRARVEDELHDLDRAIAWADQHPSQDSGEHSLELQAFACVRIAQHRAYGTPDLQPILSTLARQVRAAEASGNVGWQVQVLTLYALALQAAGQGAAAMDPLERALELAKAERLVRDFLDHGAPMEQLLRQVARRTSVREVAQALLCVLAAEGRDERPAPEPMAAAVLVEPLTPRELEILALIATGASNPEIARDLHISVNTVKRHNTNIFGKLGVTSRMQAVARGRQLQLLD